MILHSIDTGLFKLDGGAMFGVVPQSIWRKLNPPDTNNMCTWSMRCLLIEDGDRLILIDNGIGNKQDEKFFGHYDLHGDATLDSSLKAKGFSKDDITDVFLTHLHFDHCGGSIQWNSDRTKFEAAFKNATYWSNKEHWQWATEPNAREKASFLKDNILPIQETGHLEFIEKGQKIHPDIDIHYCSGHTESMMLPKIKYKGRTVVFLADLYPSVAHLPHPYVMAYDTRPLLTLSEREQFLSEAMANDYLLFFEHDAQVACATLQQTEKGIRAAQTGRLQDFI